jgi:transposase-like protein
MKMSDRSGYSKEEKLRILKEIASGKITLLEASRKYKMSPSGISYWRIHFGMRKAYGKRERDRLTRLDSPKTSQEKVLEKELEDLKVKLADLYLENEFLKKAQAFARDEKKRSSSIVTDLNLYQFKKPAD